MRNKLVKLSDKFDSEGKHDLASAIDKVLRATAAGRPRAPLKNLNDNVKKDLLKFLHKTKENIADSMEALEELFGRLRYFNIMDDVRDLGLDKTLKELGKIHANINGAFNVMYARTHGKKPSGSDLEQMAEDFGPERKTERNPLEFFESQSEPVVQEEQEGVDDSGFEEMKDEEFGEDSERLLELDMSGPGPSDERQQENEEDWEANFWEDEESFESEPKELEDEDELEGE